MATGQQSVPLECQAHGCTAPVTVLVGWTEDPGCWRDRNGDGLPPPFEWELLTLPKACPVGHGLGEDYLVASVEAPEGELGTGDDEGPDPFDDELARLEQRGEVGT